MGQRESAEARKLRPMHSPCVIHTDSHLAVGYCLAFRESPIYFGMEDLFQVSALPAAFNILHPHTCLRPVG